MTKLTALVIDDEQLARELVQNHLAKIDSIEVLGECTNGCDAVLEILRKQPEVVFLDIQMPGMNGLELVKRLQNDYMPLIIFTTAYDEHAVQAFEMNAVDYLLKPIELERLEQAVEKAIERKQITGLLDEKSKLLSTLHGMESGRAPGEDAVIADGKLAVTDSGITNLIPYEDIEWIDAAGDYMCVHAKGTTHIIRSTMKDLESKLSRPFFKRIHRSTMVNLNKVTKIEKLSKGEAMLYTEEGASLKVSRNYRSCLETLQ